MTKSTYIVPAESAKAFEKTLKKIVAKNGRKISVSSTEPKVEYYFQRATRRYIGFEVVRFEITFETESKWVLVAAFDANTVCEDLSKSRILKNPKHGFGYSRCDACGHKTVYSYVIQNRETGEELQVGCECLKAFSDIDMARELHKLLLQIEPYKIGEGGITYRDPISFLIKELKSSLAAYPLDIALSASKMQYDIKPDWEKGVYDEKSRSYKRSATATAIEETVKNGTYNELTEDYLTALTDFVSMQGNSDFETNIKRCFANGYITPSELCFAFFALKKFEDSKKQTLIDTTKYTEGAQIRLSGRVTRRDTYSYDCVYPQTIVTIVTESGMTLKRSGVVPTTSDDKVQGFAVIKKIKNNVIWLDRVTKHPKKGVHIVE